MSANKNMWQAAATGDAAALKHCLEKKFPKLKNKRVPVAGLRDNHNWTLLHHATAAASLECVELLLSRTDSDVRARSYQGLTALLVACEKNVPLAIVERLLERDRSLVNVGNNDHVSPLHKAVENGNLELVETLVVNGAEVDAKDFSDETALVTALADGHVEIVIYLLYVAHAKISNGNHILDILALRGTCDERRKLACFKLLFRYLLCEKGRECGPRYRLQDIYYFAVLSYQSISMVQHFVESALLWETNLDKIEIIKYLQIFPKASFPQMIFENSNYEYEYAEKNRFHMLQLMLAYHEEILMSYTGDFTREFLYHKSSLVMELTAFCLAAILDWNNNELFEMLIRIIDWAQVLVLTDPMSITFLSILQNVTQQLIQQEINLFPAKKLARYEMIVNKLAELIPLKGEELLTILIENQPQEHIKYFRPFISYFTNFVQPSDVGQELLASSKPFWSNLVIQYGPLEMARNMKGFTMNQFSLLRLARDATRKAVFKATPSWNRKRHVELVRRLKLLDLPACLLRYLLYLE